MQVEEDTQYERTDRTDWNYSGILEELGSRLRWQTEERDDRNADNVNFAGRHENRRAEKSCEKVCQKGSTEEVTLIQTGASLKL